MSIKDYRGLAWRLGLVLLLVALSLPGAGVAYGLWLSPQDKLTRADALFVPNGDPDYQRTRTAVRLYQRGLAPKLVFSGAGVGGDSARVMRDLARHHGVPAGAIVLEDQATSTVGNVRLTAPLLRRHGIRRVILVSSPYHLRRLKWAAQAAWPGVTLQTVRDDEPFAARWWRHPALRDAVVQETRKLIGYGLAGYLRP